MPRKSADFRTTDRIRVAAPPVAMTVVLVALHAMPGGSLHGQDWWMQWRLDLLLHAFLFGLWGLTLMVALRKGQSSGWGCERAWPFTVASGLLLALTLEWAQSALFVGRGQDVFDVLADVFGLLAAGFAFQALYLEWPVGKRTL